MDLSSHEPQISHDFLNFLERPSTLLRDPEQAAASIQIQRLIRLPMEIRPARILRRI